MKNYVKLEGSKELDAALGALAEEYGKASGKGVLRRTGDKSFERMAEAWRSRVPDDPSTPAPDYKSSITIGGKLNKRQAALARKDQSKSLVTRYLGTSDPAGIQLEYGNVNHGPQASGRPAFQQEAARTIETFGKLLGPEIEKTALRISKRRAAKLARAG